MRRDDSLRVRDDPPGPAVANSDIVAPELKREEVREVKRRTAIRAHVVHEAVRAEGEEELLRAPAALAWSGLAAGLSMGFSLVAQGLLQAHLPDTSWRPIVAKLGYSIGFLIVILGRQQLFTENTLTAILPLLSRRDRDTFVRVARLWGIVLAANLAGTVIFAVVAAKTDVFQPNVKEAFAEIGRHSLQGGFGTMVLRGIFGGWLIALLVWLLPGAETARVSIIIILTFLIGFGGFAHIVVGSTEVFYLVAIGAASGANYIVRFLVPALIGNVIGGVTLVAALNHAQVIAGEGGGP